MEWKTVFGSAARMFWSAMQCKRIRRGGDTDDDELTFALPRNLSFVKESCFDQFSVSAQFVHKPELIKGRLQQSCYRFVMEPESPNKATDSSSEPNEFHGYSEDDSLSPTRYLLGTLKLEPTEKTPMLEKTTSAGESSGNQGESVVSPVTETVNSGLNQVATPDSNSTEEGVFVNLMDDTDFSETDADNSAARNGDNGANISSPDEGAGLSPETEQNRFESDRNRLEEAFSRAARETSEQQRTSAPSILLHESDLNSDDRVLLTPSETDSDLYVDDEFNFKRSELRKTTSLKCGKTPPGTPHRKKMVRFADAMGLDLESVRHILNKDSPPKIPPSAMADLREGLAKDRPGVGSKYLTACFQQPGAAFDFHQRVMEQKVCLENAIITDLTITGFIRVANIGFNKEVHVRFSTNDWASFHDIEASYVLNSCDSRTDRFSFSLVAPADFDVGQKVQFAIFYDVNGTTYWDNNHGANYVFECFAKTIPTENENAWLHFL